MISSTGTQSTTGSSLTFDQTSRPWTDAENAAGFVLRYLVPMREQLTHWTANEVIADESLKRLITHLVTQGFGANGKGRIRDFLIRGIRSAAKSVVNDIAEEKRPAIDFNLWTPDSKAWLIYWRNNLLARAWRSLERVEHKSPDRPIYTALRASTERSDETPAMLVVRINTETEFRVDPAGLADLLASGRTLFGEMLTHEIAETLDAVEIDAVEQEKRYLGLNDLFAKPMPRSSSGND